jgi:hypothetical protein
MKNTMKISLAAVLLVAGCTSELDGKPAAKVADAKDAKKAGADAGQQDRRGGRAGQDAEGGRGDELDRVRRAQDHRGPLRRFQDVHGRGDDRGQRPEVGVVLGRDGVGDDGRGGADRAPQERGLLRRGEVPEGVVRVDGIAAKTGTRGATHEITGDLDLHGVKKSITFPATITVDERGAKGTAEFTINRKDFQIAYAGKPTTSSRMRCC